jgi:hypothetical protein
MLANNLMDCAWIVFFFLFLSTAITPTASDPALVHSSLVYSAV